MPKNVQNYLTTALISHTSKIRLKILQARFQQYVNHEIPDVQAGFRKGKRNQISNCQHPLNNWKRKRIPENHLLLHYWLGQRLSWCGSQQSVENSSREEEFSHHPYGRKWRGTKVPLDENERGEWKNWLKTQHLKDDDNGIQSHHFMAIRWGNSDRLYFRGLQNHCRWWLQTWN